MFQIDGMHLLISRGDTALMRIRTTGSTLTSADRAIFTVCETGGMVVIQKICTPDSEGNVYVPLMGYETRALDPEKAYRWELRCVIDAQLDENGGVTGGSEVVSPVPPSPFSVVRVLCEV